MQYPTLKQAKEALERLSADPDARLIAERRETALRLHNADFAVLRDEAKAREAAGRAEGRAEGERLMLRRFIVSELTRRGLNLTDELRERIEACEDLVLLEACWERARTVESAEQIFD